MCRTATKKVSLKVLVWLFHDWGVKNKINRIYERSLRIVYGGNKFSLIELLRKDKLKKKYHKNLQVHSTEIYKVKHGLSSLSRSNIVR